MGKIQVVKQREGKGREVERRGLQNLTKPKSPSQTKKTFFVTVPLKPILALTLYCIVTLKTDDKLYIY